jgi:hypothetical protein
MLQLGVKEDSVQVVGKWIVSFCFWYLNRAGLLPVKDGAIITGTLTKGDITLYSGSILHNCQVEGTVTGAGHGFRIFNNIFRGKVDNS